MPRGHKTCVLILKTEAQAYLSKGYKLGLLGGSDGHKGTPGHPRVVGQSGGRSANPLRIRDAGWMGGPLLAVLAADLDRDSLWQALRALRVYASTGARALIDFRIDGAIMGSEIEVQGPVTVEWNAQGTALIERVDLVRDQYGLMRWECFASSAQGALIDRPPDGTHYYYLRVEQQDGKLLWSSPVWVRSEAEGSDRGLPRWNEPERIDLQALGDNPAAEHLGDLLAYLRIEEQADVFTETTPLKVVHSPFGSYAVYLGYMAGRRIRIHWFFEFEIPRIRFEIG